MAFRELERRYLLGIPIALTAATTARLIEALNRPESPAQAGSAYVVVTMLAYMVPAFVGTIQIVRLKRRARSLRYIFFSTVVTLTCVFRSSIEPTNPLWLIWGWFELPILAAGGAFIADAVVSTNWRRRPPRPELPS